MKRIYIIVFVILVFLSACSTIKSVHSETNNVQVPNGTSVTVQEPTKTVVAEQNDHKATAKPTRKNKKSAVNTTNNLGKNKKTDNNKGKKTEKQSKKVANENVEPQQVTPTNKENVQAGKPKKNWWQSLWGKFDNNNDCKECESQLAEVKKANENLQKQVNDFEKKRGNIKAVMDIDDRDFYRSLIMTPLEKKYDSIQTEYYKKTVALFDHENKKEMKWVFEVYYPLLENYGNYNKELAKLIQKVIKSFELIGIPDSKTEKELFNVGLEKMEYFKKYRYKSNISQEIKYLEDVINDTKSLFDNPSKFKKESFEEQLRKLGVQNN